MYTISTKWARAIRQSHTVICRADLYPPQGDPITGLQLLGGSVEVDAEASVRRALTGCTIAMPGLIPTDPSSPAAPYGATVVIWRGIRYPDGTEELIPQGVFRLSDDDITDDGAARLTISGSDYSRTVARNAFTDPYVIAAGQNYATAIGTLAANRLPAPQRITATTETTPLIVIDVGDDPWAHLQEMASGFGDEVFFDQDGTFVLQEQQDASDDDVIEVYASGEVAEASPVLLELQRSLSDEPGYNGVVMTSESTTLAYPLRTTLFDLDPQSPTYSRGAYGQVPAFQSNPYIVSQAGCDKAASAWLRKNLGGTEEVTFSIVPNPALDAGDVVRVIRPSAGVDVVGVISKLSVPLSVSEPMQISLRSRLPLVTS